jgi:hypothetical protein
MYCGACEILQLYKNSLDTNKTPQWEDLPLPLQENLPVPPSTRIICYGCKTDVIFPGCSKCPIRKCALRHPEVENCVFCKKYPCLLFRIYWGVLFLRGFYKKLPHIKAVRTNLVTIKKIGLQAWLEEQKKEWSCPGCDTALTWYKKECDRCQDQTSHP